MTDFLNPHRISANYPIVNRDGEIQTGRIDIAPGFDSDRTPKEPLVVPTVKESLTTAEPCAWCDPNHYLLRFNVSWWVRASTGKRKWMSVTQQNKAQYCPMCGRNLEV